MSQNNENIVNSVQMPEAEAHMPVTSPQGQETIKSLFCFLSKGAFVEAATFLGSHPGPVNWQALGTALLGPVQAIDAKLVSKYASLVLLHCLVLLDCPLGTVGNPSEDVKLAAPLLMDYRNAWAVERRSELCELLHSMGTMGLKPILLRLLEDSQGVSLAPLAVRFVKERTEFDPLELYGAVLILDLLRTRKIPLLDEQRRDASTQLKQLLRASDRPAPDAEDVEAEKPARPAPRTPLKRSGSQTNAKQSTPKKARTPRTGSQEKKRSGRRQAQQLEVGEAVLLAARGTGEVWYYELHAQLPSGKRILLTEENADFDQVTDGDSDSNGPLLVHVRDVGECRVLGIYLVQEGDCFVPHATHKGDRLLKSNVLQWPVPYEQDDGKYRIDEAVLKEIETQLDDSEEEYPDVGPQRPRSQSVRRQLLFTETPAAPPRGHQRAPSTDQAEPSNTRAQGQPAAESRPQLLPSGPPAADHELLAAPRSPTTLRVRPGVATADQQASIARPDAPSADAPVSVPLAPQPGEQGAAPQAEASVASHVAPLTEAQPVAEPIAPAVPKAQRRRATQPGATGQPSAQ